MTEEYRSPFETRYTGTACSRIFSDDNRYFTWRWLWILLARAEQECGLDISDEQIQEMVSNSGEIPYDIVHDIEKETHHDVVAHLKAYAEQCPKASPIMHLGATSCYITDNTDVYLMKTAMVVLEKRLCSLVDSMCTSAETHSNTPMVGRTHLQPAQLVTLGKRYAMWMQDFKMDIENLRYQSKRVTPLGCRGATGTSDSFLQLMDGDEAKVQRMERYIVNNMGFADAFPVSGQTYTRKQDYYILQVLSGIAQSASKFATDIRLLAGFGEVSEPFGSKQVGSSAMPYKQNPIMCENICGLARFVITGVQNAAITASTQWLERSLDDSSNRRVVIPELFIATEKILMECSKVVNGLEWHLSVIEDHVNQHMDNAMVEGILIEAVKRGGDRQWLHDKLIEYSLHGDIAWQVSVDPDFRLTEKDIEDIRNRTSVGLANQQFEDFMDRIHNT